MKPIDLKAAVNSLEDAIITLSGPALAISGIIAGVDLLTGGNILKDVPVLTLAWAICLLLTLDFQVLALGVRTRRIYASDKSAWRKLAEIAIAVLIAAAISYVSIQMQSIIARANSAGLTIDQAAMQLGINPLALIWERSILVLVLIFMSGWFRDSSGETPTQDVKQESSINDETMAAILARLAKVDELEQRVAAGQVTISESSETPIALLETGETDIDEPALDAQLAALLAVNSNVTTRDAALIVGKPHTTVYRAMKRLEQPMKQPSASETASERNETHGTL
jgi:hypothetical protein